MYDLPIIYFFIDLTRISDVLVRLYHSSSLRLFINVLSVHIKGRAQCYASLHSNFQEYLWSHDAGKRDIHVGKTLIQNYQCIANTCACVESPHHLACDWHVLFVFQL